MTRFDSSQEAPFGVLAAMPEELDTVLADVESFHPDITIGDRTFVSGELYGRDVIATVGGIGKTAIAAATAYLIAHGSQAILLTGTAGRVSEKLSVGDVVVATDLAHHDFDASPVYAPGIIPGLGTSRLRADPKLVVRAVGAASNFNEQERGGVSKVAWGLVLSGDQLLSADRIVELRERFPDALAVEMEGAAVAQECTVSRTPFVVIRAISDDGDPEAFGHFVTEQGGIYAAGILRRLLPALD
jgi:adenosylhomocysteine nucleosidase